MDQVSRFVLEGASANIDPNLKKRIGIDKFLENPPEDPEAEKQAIKQILAIIRRGVANGLPVFIVADLSLALLKYRDEIDI